MTSVKDFGATGDGTTDDTESIQHAIDQGGGHIVFPRGVYRLRKPVEIDLERDGPLALSGEGGTARLFMDAAGPALHLSGTHAGTADPDSVRPGVWQHERMPTIDGIEIVGNHEQADGIRLDGTMLATITRVLIRRCRYGVHLVKRNRNLLLANTHIYDGHTGGIGVFFDGVNLHQTIIVGCHISYCPHAGIKVARSEVRNLQITGCDIEYNFDPGREDSADVWIDVREGTVREGTIASNTIQAKESPRGANVRIEGAESAASHLAGLWTITGNVLQSQAVNVLLRSCRGVNITGNSFATGFQRALLIEKCRNIVVGSNTFDHNPDYQGNYVDGISIRDSHGCSLSNLILEGTRAGSVEAGGALEVIDSSEVSIAACQILDPVHRGIELSGLRNSRVSDCTVLDRRSPPTMREAIRLDGRSRDNLILNNLAGGSTTDALHIEQGTATVAGNHVVA